MEREQKALIDTRGRKMLSDTCKRRHDSVHMASSKRARSQSPEPVPNRTRPSVDLGAMLKPSALPREKYYTIQAALIEQDRIIRDQEKIIKDRGKNIESRCTQIHNLKSQLEEAHAKTERDRERLDKKAGQISGLQKQLDHAMKDQQERKQSLEGFNNDQADLMQAGRRILAEKNGEAKQLAEENRQLRATVSGRDATISALNDQIIRISMATGDEVAAMAIESQAQRTLNLVKGLQRDVAERDVAIENYKAKNGSLSAANEKFKAENEDLKSKGADSEKALKTAEKRAAEFEQLLVDQNKLIERLLKDNEELVVGGHKR